MQHNKIIGQKLIDGLTREEQAELLGRLLGTVRGKARQNLLESLEPEVAAMIEDSSAAGTGSRPEASSNARFAEKFDSVMEEWSDAIWELQDVEGDYICQERQWEPPDLDACKFAEDIDKCAVKTLTMLPRAGKLGLGGESLFFDLCAEIEDSLQNLPEYIYTEEGISFPENATLCVLTWLDLHSAGEGEFVRRLRKFIRRVEHVELHGRTIEQFLLAGWNGERKQELHRIIQSLAAEDPEFAEDVKNPHSFWYTVRHTLAGEFSPAEALRLAKASLEADWSKGLVLIEAARAEGLPEKVLDYCARTIGSYWMAYTRQPFAVHSTMMLERRYSREPEPGIRRVLKIWRATAKKRGERATEELISIQLVFYTQPHDWDTVRDVLQRAEAVETPPLFQAWKSHILSYYRWAKLDCPGTAGKGWMAELIDAGFSGNYEKFNQDTIAWLRERLTNAGEPDGIGPPQLKLLADLREIDTSWEKYPILGGILRENHRFPDEPSRLSWLKQADIRALSSAGEEFVRHNLARLVPSPAAMSSNYERAALWLAAAREIDPRTADGILNDWKTEHKRRRNLWRDLRQHGFSI